MAANTWDSIYILSMKRKVVIITFKTISSATNRVKANEFFKSYFTTYANIVIPQIVSASLSKKCNLFVVTWVYRRVGLEYWVLLVDTET